MPQPPLRPYRDYTGVSTAQLRALILERVEDTTGFATKARISPRTLYSILNEETRFTNLTVADLVCCELDVNVNEVLTIIPANSKPSCVKMAADEFWCQEVKPTRAELHARAQELEDLRDAVLGEMTERQRTYAEFHHDFQQARYAAKRSAA